VPAAVAPPPRPDPPGLRPVRDVRRQRPAPPATKRCAINLMVNASITYLRGEAADPHGVADGGYSEDLDTRTWLTEHADPADTVLYVGIGWSETHRTPAIVKGWSRGRCGSRCVLATSSVQTGHARRRPRGRPYRADGSACARSRRRHPRRDQRAVRKVSGMEPTGSVDRRSDLAGTRGPPGRIVTLTSPDPCVVAPTWPRRRVDQHRRKLGRPWLLHWSTP
jgi:hypothetical protein